MFAFGTIFGKDIGFEIPVVVVEVHSLLGIYQLTILYGQPTSYVFYASCLRSAVSEGIFLRKSACELIQKTLLILLLLDALLVVS